MYHVVWPALSASCPTNRNVNDKECFPLESVLTGCASLCLSLERCSHCGRVERKGKQGGRKGIGRLTEGKGGRKGKEVGGLRWGEVRELQAHSFVPDFIWNMTTAQWQQPLRITSSRHHAQHTPTHTAAAAAVQRMDTLTLGTPLLI